jgi:hypothetical protein
MACLAFWNITWANYRRRPREFGGVSSNTHSSATYPRLMIPHIFWNGANQTARRLHKLANTLAALTRNAKRRDTVSLSKAVDDWERDLAFLHDRYYVNFFRFGWPETHPFLH